jgi:hypothetical protein
LIIEIIIIIITTTTTTIMMPGQLNGIELDYGLDNRWFDSRQRLGIFLSTTVSRPALGPTQPPIRWVPVAPSLVVKRPEREADHSPPCSAEVKNVWSYTSTPQYGFMAWCSVKSTGTTLHFTFIIIITTIIVII